MHDRASSSINPQHGDNLVSNNIRNNIDIIADWLELRAICGDLTTEEACDLRAIADWVAHWSVSQSARNDATVITFVADCAVDASHGLSEQIRRRRDIEAAQ